MAAIKMDQFEMTGNICEKWRRWKSDFTNLLIANELDGKSEKRKIAIFLMTCGPELKDKYDQFLISPISPATDITLKQVIEQYDNIFKTYANEIFASYLFWNKNLKQCENERFESFYIKVKQHAIDCNFLQDTLSRNIRDKLIMGISNDTLRERLLRETVLTEKSVVEQCLISEQSRVQSSLMSNGNGNGKYSNLMANVDQIKNTYSRKRLKNSSEKFNCKNCGKFHEKRNCPAFGKKCHNCSKLNHYEIMCKTSNYKNKNNNSYQKSKKIHEIESDQNNSENEIHILSELKIYSLNDSRNIKDWLINFQINGNFINCKLDTGAQVNIISIETLKQLKFIPTISKTKTIVKAFGGTKINLFGECILNCSYNNNNNKFKFLITDFNSKTILGLEICKYFQLIKIIDNIYTENDTPQSIIDEYSDVFEGIGSLEPVKIKLQENAIPHIAASRKIPLALHEPVQQELKRMVKDGIIEKVEVPTDWVSNMHVINKSGKIRIVLDPRPLNKYIQRAHYPIPTIEELYSKMQDCKIFTLFDAKTAFWQQPLDKESSFLTTFISPFGRYRWLKVPYGLVSAPENFQNAMTKMFQDIPQANPYFDDIALGSPNLIEHCKLLRKVLDVARKENLKLNKEKIQLATNKINYLGQILSDKGMLPDPRKIIAINEFPSPKNKDSLHRFLSMYRYHTKYTQNVSHESFVLRQLLKKDSLFVWDTNMQKCFDNLKSMLVKAPILQIFQSNKHTTLSVDASKYGLGAALIQNDKPVGFGSATLNDTQQRYAQIEKELLAIVFGLEHFHYYTYGRRILVETDHKPLLGLSKKPYDQISPRLQNMLLKLNKYDFELKYVPGKDLITADTLSRAPLHNSLYNFYDYYSNNNSNTVKIHLLVNATDNKWNEIRKKTIADKQLQTVKFYINNGWPENFIDIRNSSAKQFWHCRDELYIKDDIICRGQRLVIPQQLVNYILTLIHVSHKGIVSNKIKAREYYYWPNMDSDIEKFINNCNICQKYQRSNQYEPLIDRTSPIRPWQKIATDFLDLNGKRYLLVIDYFSKYIELQIMQGTSANAVINAFKIIYARFGIPDEMISDRGPPFNSIEMTNFHREWNINHNPSTPYYPRSNGQVERCVQTVKKSLLKCSEEGKDINIVLLDYRTTSTNNLPSPAELLMGRKIKTNLPIHPKQLKPNYPIKHVKDELKRRQTKQKRYANEHTKQLPRLHLDDKVWFRKNNSTLWIPGTIIKINPFNSYLVKSCDGRTYERNRIYFRPNKSLNNYINNQTSSFSVEDYYITTPLNHLINTESTLESPIDTTNNLENINNSQETTIETRSSIPSTINIYDSTGTSNNTQDCPTSKTRSGRNVMLPNKFKDFIVK